MNFKKLHPLAHLKGGIRYCLKFECRHMVRFINLPMVKIHEKGNAFYSPFEGGRGMFLKKIIAILDPAKFFLIEKQNHPLQPQPKIPRPGNEEEQHAF